MPALLSPAAIDRAARAKVARTRTGTCPFCGDGLSGLNAYATLHALPRATGTAVGDELTGVAGPMPADAFLVRACTTCGAAFLFAADRAF